MQKSILIIALFGSVQAANAGVLTLENGDHISGSLKGIQDGKIKWNSVQAGDIVIQQQNVKGIVTEGYFSLKADEKRQFDACFQLPNRDVPEFQCAQGEADLPSWKSISGVTPQTEDMAKKFLADGDVAFSGIKTGGKTRGQTLEFASNLRARYRDQRHFLNFSALRDQSEDEIIVDERKASYRIDKFFSEKWFYTGNLAWKRDRFADLADRYDVGVGIGYQFWDVKEGSLMVQVTPFYRQEHFIEGEDQHSSWFAIHTEYRKVLGDWGLEFFHNNTLSQSTSLAIDFEVETETGFKMPLAHGLSLRSKFDYNFDGRPSFNSRRDDSKFVIGLNYDW